MVKGRHLAMAMFALASVPLIRRVDTPGAKQTWFADDTASGGHLIKLRQWWDRLNEFGPMYGYFPNSVKTNLIVKAQHEQKARAVFQGTEVNITVDGKRYLGGAIGTRMFTEDFLNPGCKSG